MPRCAHARNDKSRLDSPRISSSNSRKSPAPKTTVSAVAWRLLTLGVKHEQAANHDNADEGSSRELGTGTVMPVEVPSPIRTEPPKRVVAIDRMPDTL